jgi:hypothetical protein
MELLTVLNVFPIVGPSRRITAITTMATNAKMIAYSTSPWPFSLMADNIINSFQKGFPGCILSMPGLYKLLMYLAIPLSSITKKPCLEKTGLLLRTTNLAGQGGVDGAEGIADLGSKQTHDSNYDDGDESEDDRVLDEALAFFFRCKQHDIISFLINVFV